MAFPMLIVAISKSSHPLIAAETLRARVGNGPHRLYVSAPSGGLEDQVLHIGALCIVAAAVFGVIGMAMGLFMGIGGDFSLAHAHSHINLAGWATLAIYGLYHRGVVRKRNALAWVQATLALVGTPLFTLALTAYLLSGTETKAFIVIAMLSGVLVAASMVLFLAVVIADARAAPPHA